MPPLDILSITPRLEYISDLIQGQRVLSLGGFGWDAFVACNLGAQEALYVDPRPHRVRYAEERVAHPKAMAIEGTWDDLPLEDSCIDVVLMTGLPLDTRERRYALSEARRVLTPDGFLLLTLENTGPIRLGGRLLNPSRIPSSPSLRSDLRRQFPQVEFLHQRVDLGVTIAPSAQGQTHPSYVNHQGEPPPLAIAICSRLMILPTEVSLNLGGLDTLKSHAMALLRRNAAVQSPVGPSPEGEDQSEALKEAKDALKAMELDLQVALDDAHQLRTQLQNLGLGAPSLSPDQSAGKESLKEALLGDLLDEPPIRVITNSTPLIEETAPEELEASLEGGSGDGSADADLPDRGTPPAQAETHPAPDIVAPTPGALETLEDTRPVLGDSQASEARDGGIEGEAQSKVEAPRDALTSEDEATSEDAPAPEDAVDDPSGDEAAPLSDLLRTTAEHSVPEWSIAETQAIDREELATEVTEPIVTEPIVTHPTNTESDVLDPVGIPDLTTLPEVTPPSAPSGSPASSESEAPSEPANPLRLSPMAQWKGGEAEDRGQKQSILEDELDASIARALRGGTPEAEAPPPQEHTEAPPKATASEAPPKATASEAPPKATASEAPSGEISELKEALEVQQRRLDELQATLLAQETKETAIEEAPEEPRAPDTAHWPGRSALPLAMPSLFDSLGDGDGGGLERPQDGELALLAAITPENLSKLPQVVQSEDDD